MVCARRSIRLKGGGDDDGDGGHDDGGAGQSPEGLYLSSNSATGYRCVYKAKGGITYFIQMNIKVEGGHMGQTVSGFATAIDAARMYKRIKDGEITLEGARASILKTNSAAKVRANLEARKAKLEAELEEVCKGLANLE